MQSTRKHNILIYGFFLVVRRLPALLWTYILTLALALLFSLRLHGALDALLSHSLAAQSLSTGFDLARLIRTFTRLGHDVPGGSSPSPGGILLAFLVYFLLTPGVLFCYTEQVPARLSTMLAEGLRYFWRFVRISLLLLLATVVILGPLLALYGAINGWVVDHLVGRPQFLAQCCGIAVVLLVASVIRLYFDLVEVYTVQIGGHLRPNGRPDRRVRTTLGPAWRTLRRRFASAWILFLLLAVAGAAAMTFAGAFVVTSLAAPRVWLAFLVGQAGLLLLLFSRFWQRGMETTLAANFPIYVPELPAARRYATERIVPVREAAVQTTHVPAPPAVPVEERVGTERVVVDPAAPETEQEFLEREGDPPLG